MQVHVRNPQCDRGVYNKFTQFVIKKIIFIQRINEMNSDEIGTSRQVDPEPDLDLFPLPFFEGILFFRNLVGVRIKHHLPVAFLDEKTHQ